MPDVAITGASGVVGGHLTRTLVERGSTVSALVRSDEAAAKVRQLGAEPVLVELFDDKSLREALWGVPLLYHVAGVNKTCVRNPREMDRVNVAGTASIVEAASDAGVGRVVFTSSAAVIGEPEGTIGHEETVHTGEFLSPYARSKYLAEQTAFQTASSRDVDLVAVNPSSVQGPGRSTGSARILISVLRDPRPRLLDTKVSIVDIGDCTEGHIAAAERGRRGERYLLAGATVSVSEAVDIASEITGRTIQPRWLSENTVRVWGGLAARIASMVRPDGDICPALIKTLLHSHRFDASKSERDLGLRYTPIEATFSRTIQWFTEEGLI